MTTLEGGHKIEIKPRQNESGATEYYAQIHCWCGSTLSSGVYCSTIGEATREARDGITTHERTGNHARGHFKQPCGTCGGVAFVFPRTEGKAQIYMCVTCWSRKPAAGAP